MTEESKTSADTYISACSECGDHLLVNIVMDPTDKSEIHEIVSSYLKAAVDPSSLSKDVINDVVSKLQSKHEVSSFGYNFKMYEV